MVKKKFKENQVSCLVNKGITKEDVKELKQKQQRDLEEQIKKESGWR